MGVFIKTWHPDFLPCNEEEERKDAMRNAAHLDIPFLTFDLEKEYKKGVADYMISEYRAGRTPNPDVMCNREVKFGAFMRKALAMGADFIATGHYARTSPRPSPYQGEGALRKGLDPAKDQSYFLWTLNQNQLSKILFPVGHLKKTEVRLFAKKFKIPVAEKKDSQGICFLGAVDLKEFLKHYIKAKRGKVLDEKGNEIGHHDGAVFYTLGERHGFTITKKTPHDEPYYVVGKDIKKNELIVSQDHHPTLKGTPPPKGGEKIKISQTNWISGLPDKKKKYTCQIRYHGEFLSCRIKILPKNYAEIYFIHTASGLPAGALVAAGQSLVVYDGDICLGGGVIE